MWHFVIGRIFHNVPKTLQSFKMTGTNHAATQYHILEDLTLHQQLSLWQINSCYVSTCTCYFVW